MLSAEAFQNEDHDITLAQVAPTTVDFVFRRKNAFDILWIEVIHFVVLEGFVERAQEAIRIAECEPGLFRRIGHRVAHLDPRFFGVESAAHPTDAQESDDEGGNAVGDVIPLVAFDFGGLVFDVMPAVDEKGDESEADDDER